MCDHHNYRAHGSYFFFSKWINIYVSMEQNMQKGWRRQNKKETVIVCLYVGISVLCMERFQIYRENNDGCYWVNVSVLMCLRLTFAIRMWLWWMWRWHVQHQNMAVVRKPTTLATAWAWTTAIKPRLYEQRDITTN
jgi:hypothetical protein